MLWGRVVFATEESSPFDVAVVELEESVPGFVPPCLASTFLPGTLWGHTGCSVGAASPPCPHLLPLPCQGKR